MQAADIEKRKAQREQQDRQIRRCLEGIKNTILVMSGKGGVGKSCVAVSLAVGLANRGYRVGLMDVDLHGPSIPQMLGIPAGRGGQMPEPGHTGITFAGGKIIPARCGENLSVVSIECMLESRETAVVWRGPMKYTAIRQFVSDVAWDELDYLVVDSPPGTGDEPLTVAQTIPNAGAVIVTTPQAVSLRDVRKSIQFCNQVHMQIIGLIENMSGLVCPGCGRTIDLFKTGGGEAAARETGVPFLGRIPIIPDVVSACDDGVPAIKASEAMDRAFEPILVSLTGASHSSGEKQTVRQPFLQKEDLMKIAIPLAQGRLALHFGHCQEFALIEVDEGEKKITGEESLPAPDHQPGLLPRWLHEKGANVIIAGGMGSRAQQLFAENKIQVVTGAPAQDPRAIVSAYLNGTLATEGNLCDH
ncbi:MAG: P-loop NTPase [Chitinivibrionales bacterium]|nr:P-loop NTPase [Chitinivibrionales bacterium]MBD3396433.1 P-loop NTPase [Chitinivibrionales bacterium]